MSFALPVFENPSVMKHDFSRVPHAEIARSAFRRSHGYKTTFEAGEIIPIYCDEALPGDTFKLKLTSVVRMPTQLGTPVMDNMYVDYFFFAVPCRLLWENWEKFMGAQDDPGDSTDFTVPQLDMSGVSFAALSLGDYMGIPPTITDLEINSLHFRAYNLIWNEWFRDQNLQDSVVVDVDDGPDDPADYVLLKRGKRHDYFTSCLPWPQKGTAVDLPLGTDAPVIAGSDRSFVSAETTMRMWNPADGTYRPNDFALRGDGVTGNIGLYDEASSETEFLTPSNLWADLSSATAATINELREAFQIQKLMERDARGGTRYVEILKSHFRVTSPDFRLQRPEYLGGGTKRISVECVADQGSLAAYVGRLKGTAFHQQTGIGFTKSFVEHCVILGLINVRADLTYQTGVERMWSRQTKYDYYWPALAHIGEQAVLNKEIYAQTAGAAANDQVFGYQEAWAEYRYKPSLITGVFRSDHGSSLDSWHLSEDFSSLPVLNASFITSDPPTDRIVGVVGEPAFVLDAFFDVVATRPMPMYSVPGLIDHF